MLNDTRTAAQPPHAASARDGSVPSAPPVAGVPIQRIDGRRSKTPWTHNETLQLLALRKRGLRNYEIAREMGRSEVIIKNNVTRLRQAGVTIARLPTGLPKGTPSATPWWPPTKSKSDCESKAKVQARASRLASFWHKRGFLQVKFWVEQTDRVHGHPIFEIRSNLVNGHPPVGR